MACDHHWERLTNAPRDRVKCTHCDTEARALAPFRTGLDHWTFQIVPQPAPSAT